ncbi:MAG: hypothetical protein JWO60_2905 [Frankiales bacterium]|nr:hypothetical protein [Frankiales bacterium]
MTRVDLPGLRLDPDPRAAAAARRHVRAVLGPAGLGAVEDEALLVLSELVTNAVVHAGTEVHVALAVERPGVLRLEVADRLPGVTPVVRDSDDAREGGRGMFLLNNLAEEWGTTYRRDGKAVWCLLGGKSEDRRRAGAERQVAAVGMRTDLAWLLELPADLEDRLPVRLVLAELLHRLCDAMGVEQAAVLAGHLPTEPWRELAARGPTWTDEERERAEAAARRSPHRVVPDGDVLVLPLRARAGVVGSLVLRCEAAATTELHAVARLVADRLGVLVADEQMEAQRQQDRGALSLLAEASDMFAGSLDVQLAWTLATQLVVPRFGAWAAVLSFPEQGPRLEALNCGAEEQLALLRVALSSEAGTALARGLSGTLSSVQPVVVDPGAVLFEFGADVLAVPLVARRRLLGCLLVGRSTGRYGAQESDLLLDLGRRAALASDNARLYEDRSAVARALQASLLPAVLPTSAHAEFGAVYAAAGEGNEVGGDFYDVFALGDGRHVVAIGDVCGKGPEAAAITGLARQVLRLSLRDGRSASEAYARLNAAILELGDAGRFLTSALAVLRPVPGGLEAVLSCAGHPAPVLRRASGACATVGEVGDLLGVLPQVDVPPVTLHLEVGDSLVFYTDGVTERRNADRQFGEDGLLAALAGTGGGDAATLARRVQTAVLSYSRTAPRDDMAVLTVQVPALQDSADVPVVVVEPA